MTTKRKATPAARAAPAAPAPPAASTPSVASVTQLVAGDEAKMTNIMDEVDRFFKSVHADIEDWKFSMEDFGDGTRIFVRFQIHFDKSDGSTTAASSPGKKGSHRIESGGVDGSPTRGGKALPAGGDITTAPHPSEGTAAATTAEQDLASFVDDWRRKRDSGPGGEYHKEGAPYVDGKAEWNGQKRTREDSSSTAAGERTDAERKVPDASK
jgi:hypothetical protein